MKNVRALACALLLVSTGLSISAAAAQADEGPANPVAIHAGHLETTAMAEVPESTPLGFYWQLTLAQPVLPGTFLLAGTEQDESPRNTSPAGRSDQEFFAISSTGSNDIPDAALRAYRNAAAAMSSCGIKWTFLAAIGRVESNHGRFAGSQLGSDGVSRPAIIGLQLNGAGPVAAIRDTDGGSLDGDKVWDRAVGQMQFIPGTWAMSARDGDGDGKANPHDLDDSALAAATYLCGAGNLATVEGMKRAAFRYNQSDYYVALVLSFARGYETGVFAVPSPPPPPAEKVKREKKRTAKAAGKAGQDPKGAGTTKAPTKSSAGPATKPSKPSTKPSSTPKPSASPSSSPKPTPPAPTPARRTLQGTLVACNGGSVCISDGGFALDLTALSQAHRDEIVAVVGTSTVVKLVADVLAGTAKVLQHELLG